MTPKNSEVDRLRLMAVPGERPSACVQHGSARIGRASTIWLQIGAIEFKNPARSHLDHTWDFVQALLGGTLDLGTFSLDTTRWHRR
jgi:hypothetical protein